jgi:hypothetical protein
MTNIARMALALLKRAHGNAEPARQEIWRLGRQVNLQSEWHYD